MIEPKSENKFPDCLSMKLHGEPITETVQPSSSSVITSTRNPVASKSITQQIDLKLTIRFGEQQHKLDIRYMGIQKTVTVTFGLQGGELKLKLSNAKTLLESIELTDLFKPLIEREFQNENSGEVEIGIKAGGKAGNKKTVKHKDDIPQVYSRGTEEEPIWLFQVKANHPVLSGMLRQAKICTLKVNAKPCIVEAVFEIKDKDIRFTKPTQGVLWGDISRNRTALIEKLIYLKALMPQLQPYLSRVELSYE